jgi:hypothetical protein
VDIALHVDVHLVPIVAALKTQTHLLNCVEPAPHLKIVNGGNMQIGRRFPVLC